MKIKNKKIIKYNGKVYDLSVENSSTYNVEGLGVHNSSAGCLISYMLDITDVDPIRYNLVFERFYNDGRNTKDKVSLPDIDTDFEIGKRESVIQYIRDRYGDDRVCQVTTFGSLKGKGALKETLRVHQACDETTMNKMSKLFPDEAKIQDELEEQKETSIIRWTLRNRPDVVADYCQMDEEENLTGEYSKYFEQAIRLEGTYKSYGKHASALCIGYKPIKEICPLIDEKSGDNMIAAIEYEFLEEMGVPKLDILGLASLDKLTSINKLLKMPYIEEEHNE